MKNLLKMEWFKLIKSPGVKAIYLFDILTIFLAIYMLSFGKKLTGYMGMSIGAGSALYHMAFVSLLAAVFICNEFSNGAFGISLLSGYSRQQLFWSKVFVFFWGSISLFLIFLSIFSSVFTIANGFGHAKRSEILVLLFCESLGVLTMGSFSIFISILTRNAFITVAICNFFSNNVIDQTIDIYMGRRSNPLLRYTFIYQFDQLALKYDVLSGFANSAQDEQRIYDFSPGLFLSVMLISLTVFLTISAVIFEKRNLK